MSNMTLMYLVLTEPLFQVIALELLGSRLCKKAGTGLDIHDGGMGLG